MGDGTVGAWVRHCFKICACLTLEDCNEILATSPDYMFDGDSGQNLGNADWRFAKVHGRRRPLNNGREVLRASLGRRSESTDLLEPYVPDLLAVGDRSSPLRRMALGVLVYTKPKVSPKTIAYFSAHLSDRDNTVDDVNVMAWTLLEEGSDSLTQRVVAFVRGQSDPKVIEAVLRCFLVFTAKNSDALAYIGSSLDSPDVWVRRRAVEALQRLPLVARSPFLEQLNRLATDPKEPAEVRSEAAEALRK